MASDLAVRIAEASARHAQAYAVFGGRQVEYMPASGKRFAMLQRDPLRMAHLVGVFERNTPAAVIDAALSAAGCA